MSNTSTTGDRAASPTIAARLGSTATVAGVFGGLVGGLVGLVLFGLADLAISDFNLRRGALAFSVSIAAVVMISAWQDLTAAQYRRAGLAAARMVPLAIVGAAVGLVLASPVFGALDGYDASGSAAIPALAFAFSAVAGAVGVATGVVVSSRKALIGLIGGVVGGAFGGAILAMAGGDARASLGQLVIAVPLVTATLGGAMGATERFVRESWIEVVDGPQGGREITIYGDVVVVGNGADAVSLGDPVLKARHLLLDVSGDQVVVEPGQSGSLCEVNFEPIDGRRSITAEDVVSVGDTHFKVRSK